MALLKNSSRPASALICVVLLIARARSAGAGVNVWTTHGPEDSSVLALVLGPTTPTTLYAGMYDGVVFKSTDSARSWKATGAPRYVGGLTIDPTAPSTIYTANTRWGEPHSVFKSTDGGDTWQFVGQSCVPGERTEFVVDPATPTTLYLGLSPQCEGEGCVGGGVCKSTDGGGTWRLIDSRFVRTLQVAPTVPTSLYLSSGGDEVVKSTDGGDSWAPANTGLISAYVVAFAIDPTTPTTIYAASAGAPGPDGVYKSTDAGTIWSETSAGRFDLDVFAVAVDPTTPTTLYAGTWGAGVFKSVDGGGTWKALNAGLTDLNVYALAIDPVTPRRVYAGTGAGVFAIEQTCVVGAGTSASCTEAALDACLPGGAEFTGAVTFNCGPSPTTITVSSTKSVSANTSIDGGGLVTLDGNHAVEVFLVAQGSALNLENLTIVNGLYHCEDSCEIRPAGAIHNSGTVTVSNSTFSGNGGDFGGAISNGDANSVGTLTVTNSTFFGNSAGTGGGIENFSGTATVTNSTFFGNSGTSGGGIYNDGGTVTVTKSTFSGNSAYSGGAIDNRGTLTVTDSIFSGGSATYGGGIHNDGALTVTNSIFSGNVLNVDSGGGIYNGGSGSVSNSTFFGNTARRGGGIANFDTLTVTNSTFFGNVLSVDYTSGGAIYNYSGAATVTNTILANSTSGRNCFGSITDGGHNLDDGTTCGFTGAGCTRMTGGSLCNANPLLDPSGLQNNGGPTQTIALQGGSPAINAGDESICAAAPINNLDQRGFVRPGAGATNCSIGAYEFNSPGPPPPCMGDCLGDNQVTINELLMMVNIALGEADMSECEIGDDNDDGVITVDEILMALNSALNGCPLTPEQVPVAGSTAARV